MERSAAAGVDESNQPIQPPPGSQAPQGRLAETEDADLDTPAPDVDRLLTDAVAQAGPDAELGGLVRRYWRLVPDEEMVGLSVATMLADVREHRELAAQRVPGELKLAVRDSADGERTVITTVTDDMPFLVDTMTSTLAVRDVAVHLLIHPLVVVRRAPLGALTAVNADAEPDMPGPGELAESWMRLEVDRIRDPEARERLQRDLQQALTDVREAVEDWSKMRQTALELATYLSTADLPVPDRDISDSIELLEWLAEDHFTFLGYREYELHGDELRAVLGTGLGILRSDVVTPRNLSSVAPEAREKVLEKRLLIITKANSRSTVHRAAYLDYIGFKTFDAQGNVSGEKRFLGLLSSAAYLGSVRDIPVVKRKVAAVLERSGLSPRSHSGKDLLATLEEYPRDELFQIRTDELYDAVMGVLRMAGRRQLRLFLRKDGYGRFISCLVFLPRDRFTTSNRLAIQDILLRELRGVGVDYTTRVGESALARIHFTVRTNPASPPGEIDTEALQRQLAEVTRNWDDDFRALLERRLGEDQSRDLYDRYVAAFDDGYKDQYRPIEAVKDIAKMELLDPDGDDLVLHLFRRRKDDNDVRFKIFRYGEPMMLSTVLPVLHSLGVQVTDERPYEIRRADATIHLYDFGLVLPADARELADIRTNVENAFSATWRGDAESDHFNELVVRAGLTWRQVSVLRAYARYLRQAGTVYSPESMEVTFNAYPGVAALMVALFDTRFDPHMGLSTEDRALQAKELVAAISRELDQVSSLDQDRILRSYLTLIQATLRTSFFQRGVDGRAKPYVAVKLEPRVIADLPAPRPRYEIWVYAARFEGVHLRFGPVARGGLRWSDRRDDFRTEILGLVKAQTVKNAVIVPVGAKGGFVLKAAPPPSDRDAYLAEGVACYRLFIGALLDVTDNLVGGTVRPPADLVRHDGDDPYLVVAADKGTATFSDFANAISVERGFWLGDAFASGGSAGYDHKKMGITARGAWESVKHHFREMGTDIQTQDFTVVGIGDMSGDVFGNAMLLSRHIRLVAAFDHRHIFIDPDPDPAASYAERQRLFDLPRSSWADYDHQLISAGGGVWPRTAKSIPLTPAAAHALSLPESTTALAPTDLLRVILAAPVDLLFNGGIGTYVKAVTESHLEVGDKANDPIRLSGRQVRARVIGEGGNLGLTQRGRVEYALAGGPAGQGGRICTDFIDNSAGVDTSDHEVNIKILLGPIVAAGHLTTPERDTLLAEMTDEVGALVLRDNYGQATALGNARAQAGSLLSVHRRLLSELEREGRLDRTLEGIPPDDELQARFAAGGGLTSPEFAVLLAYVKIALEDEISASSLPDDAWTHQVLEDYFPGPLRERYAAQMRGHRLRREIVTTALVNEVVNQGGTTFVFRTVEETGVGAADVLRAYVIVRDVYGLPAVWRAVEGLDTKASTAAQTAIYLSTRRLLDRAVRWVLTSRRMPLDVSGEIDRLRPGVQQLLGHLGDLVHGQERDAMAANAASLLALGIPEELADWSTRVMYGFGVLDIVTTAEATGKGESEVAGVYYALAERYQVDDILTKISMLPRDDRWQTLARMALRYDLYGALAALTTEVLSRTDPQDSAPVRVTQWEQANADPVSRARAAIADINEAQIELAPLSVLLRQIRTLVRTTTA